MTEKIKKNPGSILRWEHWKGIALILMGYDILAVTGAYFLALFVRFEFSFNSIPKEYLQAWKHFAPWYALLCLLVFFLFRLYNSIWRFASYNELIRVIASTVVTSGAHVLLIAHFFCRMPRSYYLFGAVFQGLLVLGVRFSYRFVLLLKNRGHAAASGGRPVNRVMLIGAGSSGQLILRDIQRAKELSDRVVCIIDDNSNKWGRTIDGIPVAGGRDEILFAVEKYEVDSIYVAIPSATPAQLSEILNICKETGCPVKNLPGVYQLVNGEVSVSALRDVSVEELLGREPIRVEMSEIYNHLEDRTILVTGGGGSIGSELCRQIAQHSPKQLIIFDIYENNAYDIQQELVKKHPELNLAVLIGSVRDSHRINAVFETYKPDIVFHAAAHKHVPLMEDSPAESIKNNVFGTYKTAYAAMMNGCRRFVLISTDKAVNPTNIMGASKRMCEMVIQTFDKKIKANREAELPLLNIHGDDEDGNMLPFLIPGRDNAGYATARTEFVAVRFGNVLGSNGSVIPLFKKQIAEGGPVTVTHKDIIRYFMTIPEAVSLVLQAGVYAKGGEIFVLDMGEPVKIDDLARNLIKLSGLKPDADIPIVYTGLRPGEKLYEEKLMLEEGMKTTPNHLIHIGRPIEFDENAFLESLGVLMEAAYVNDPGIKTMVERMVPTYHQEKGG